MKFRKKPVVIEATCFDNTHAGVISCMRFMGITTDTPCTKAEDALYGYCERALKYGLPIETLEDGGGMVTAKHVASVGDWIIKGVHGEFYACKPDIFVETYEPVK